MFKKKLISVLLPLITFSALFGIAVCLSHYYKSYEKYSAKKEAIAAQKKKDIAAQKKKIEQMKVIYTPMD